MKFWSFFVRKKSFSYLLFTLLLLLGVTSLMRMPRESSPEVQVPVAIVTTVFPGASAVDVERLITNKIEDQLNNLEGLRDITSTSAEGVSSVVVEFDADADIDESIQNTKDEVDKIKPELPEDGDEPFVSEVNFVDEPILQLSVATDLPLPEFISLTEELEDEITAIAGVSRVETSGIPSREVQVVVEKDSLSQFGLSLFDVTQAISSANVSLPVGNIEIDGITYAIQFDGDLDTAAEIGDIPITTIGGQAVYVRDVAFISDGVSEPETLSRISIDGEPSEQAATLFIFKQRGGDITKINDAVLARVDELKEDLLLGATVLSVFDAGEDLRTDLRNLSFTALQTVALVMIILFFAIGWREALIAGVAIPMSFLIAFIGLEASGNTFNFVSLFSLILAVGILVDSAIVITEAIHTKLLEGHDKTSSVLQTLKEFHLPLLAGTATTVAFFVPLFFLSGVTGQFIKTIPFTIVFVLTASIFVALGIIPIIASRFLKNGTSKPSKLKERQEHYTKVLQTWYRDKLGKILASNRIQKRFMWSIGIGFFVFFLMPVFGVIGFNFFPQEDIDFIYLEVELPQGTVLEETDLVVRRVEEILYDEPVIESFVTTVGTGNAFGSGGSDSKLGNMTITLRPDRKITSTELVERLRSEARSINDAIIRVGQPSSGPPGGAPIVIKVLGKDLDSLEEGVTQVEALLNDIDGTANVTPSNRNDSTEFIFTIDRAKAAEVGVSPLAVASTLRTAVFGTEATTLESLSDDIDVTVLLDLNARFNSPFETNETTVDELNQIEILTPNGPVLLGSLAEVSLGKSSAVIRHEDRKRLQTVSADLELGVTLPEVFSEFNERVDELELPRGVEIVVGGETEENTQSLIEMILAFFWGLLLMFAVIVLQFNSFQKAFFNVVVILASLIGVYLGLIVTGNPLSFSSVLGYLALAGIVVNNAIILIDVMNQLRIQNGKTIREVVLEGATSRLRPILLTTLTTVIGVIPLTYASELWAPLAIAIMSGLLFATIITLVLVPIMYYRWPGEIK